MAGPEFLIIIIPGMLVFLSLIRYTVGHWINGTLNLISGIVIAFVIYQTSDISTATVWAMFHVFGTMVFIGVMIIFIGLVENDSEEKG